MMVEEHGEIRSQREFRKHLIWYTRGLRGATDFRSEMPTWRTIPEMTDRIQEYFRRLRATPDPEAPGS